MLIQRQNDVVCLLGINNAFLISLYCEKLEAFKSTSTAELPIVKTPLYGSLWNDQGFRILVAILINIYNN